MQLMLLDFGACQELSETARLGYLRILQASIIGDQKTLASTLSALGFKTRSGKPDTLLAFTHALLTQLTERLSAQPEESPWLSEDELLAHGKELLAKLQEDPVDHLPPDFIMLARVFLSLGGLFVHYRPTMNLPALILKHLTWPQPAMAH
jgi:predicted unusual protein kinase regulating ubiquinone biosynthesis (AarF/ABC1/UbiB family)